MECKIIDTHVHVWDLRKASYPWLNDDTSILKRTYTIDELDDERKRVGVTAGVLVQASGKFEDTDLMFETAAATDWIAGVVAWLPLTNTEATSEVLNNKYANNKHFKGVRHQIHDEPEAKWLLQPEVINSLKLLAERNIPFDVVAVLPQHIEAALEVVEKVPELKMVFDHLSQPPAKAKEGFGRWGELMREAAKHKKIYVKISGLGTGSGKLGKVTNEYIKPYIEFACQHFGTDRCFCGGDWPVSLLADSYTNTWQSYKQILAEILSEEERKKILYSNAKAFYKLDV